MVRLTRHHAAYTTPLAYNFFYSGYFTNSEQHQLGMLAGTFLGEALVLRIVLQL